MQGSARIHLPDGALRRLVYAGRNGQPYTSIGRVLVDTLGIPPAAMGLAQLKDWIRAHGEKPGEAGAALMARNRSYIFFAFDDALAPDAGPIGGAGVSLAPLRSLAIDRALWPYGLPFFIDAGLALAGRGAEPVPTADGGAGHRRGDPGDGARRHLLWFRSGRRRPRRPAAPPRHALRALAEGRGAVTKPPEPPGRRLRRLSEEEIELWLSVAERVERRPDSRLPDRVPLPPAAAETPLPVVAAPVRAPAKAAAAARPPSPRWSVASSRSCRAAG